MRPFRILFNAWADRENVNAQNLNARDIAFRLDSRRFSISLFSQQSPDPRLRGKKNISLIQVPRRIGSLVMLLHMIGRYDAIFYLRFSRADSIYRWFRRRRLDRKRVITAIESPVDVIENPEYPRSIRRYYDDVMRLADLAVANSPYVAKTIRERYKIQIPIIYSGVDVSYFQRVAAQHPRGTGSLRVMFAGSFQERKHPELVLEAARKLPDTNFVLMGDGPLKPLLVAHVAEENLSNVTLLSTEEYTEYAKLLATADIFFFPSRIEGLGKVLLEAAASGIPVLVFDDYETPAVVDRVTGFQCKTFEELMDRLRLLIENRDLRLKMGAAGAEHAKKFDWGGIVRQWEEVFEETIARRVEIA